MKLLQFLGLCCLFCINFISADPHNFCACGLRHGKTAETDAYWRFDTNATTYACESYRHRDSGDNQWDRCPDCHMDWHAMDAHVGIPSCFSWKWHMGGDEFDYYCGLNGFQGYCKDAK
ncbi:uncharacterized protein LY79DRAFT_570647 [Colletotrichum navitas]|uniref:Uncharacterized protein n=1 Tax=Colletotrichum navitas TaxID=681940 RepID=A0AAD8UZQ7_9PEZI|nr:uncharacterized protein LY79DRAFT_570647 [Colletotrichum navitas]KAK1570034.1 hypothetical protein LY79DRAFT_570647 [Colletotrichum navitas]